MFLGQGSEQLASFIDSIVESFFRLLLQFLLPLLGSFSPDRVHYDVKCPHTLKMQTNHLVECAGGNLRYLHFPWSSSSLAHSYFWAATRFSSSKASQACFSSQFHLWVSAYEAFPNKDPCKSDINDVQYSDKKVLPCNRYNQDQDSGLWHNLKRKREASEIFICFVARCD